MTHVGVEEFILQTDEKKCTSRGHGWWGGGERGTLGEGGRKW